MGVPQNIKDPTDRLYGILFVLFALMLYFYLIPMQVGTVDVMGLVILVFCIIARPIVNSASKRVIAAALGMLAATIGTHPQQAAPRL